VLDDDLIRGPRVEKQTESDESDENSRDERDNFDTHIAGFRC